MAGQFWLLKSEPRDFSIEDLQRSPHQTAPWDGVRNYQARNYIRDRMRNGDEVLFYHSGARPAVVGTARVVREACPDHTAWDPASSSFDPRSTAENPVWYMVDVRFEQEFPRPLSLAELKTLPELQGMMLLRKGNRLSVQPVSRVEYRVITSRALYSKRGTKRKP